MRRRKMKNGKIMFGNDCYVDIKFESVYYFSMFDVIMENIELAIEASGYKFVVESNKSRSGIIITNTSGSDNWKGKISNVLKQCVSYTINGKEHFVEYVAWFGDGEKFTIKRDENGKVVRITGRVETDVMKGV